jgi:NADH dehydrogenase
VEGFEHVWSLGDCACVPNRASEVPDPPTCQHALRQAQRLAKNLKGESNPYSYRMLGQVATLGRYKGIADVVGLRLTGFLGWFVTRTYHLYQLPLLSRKLRVVVDWTVSLFFRRDIAELGMLGHPQRLGDA